MVWRIASGWQFSRGRRAPPPANPAPPVPAPLVLAGGTLIDVTDWGRSARDQQNSIVIVQHGRIAAVGSRTDLPIPPGARVIDCTGKFLIPGLVDGFAGMNSQGQANANLYMGVTTVVARADDHHGHVDFAANPTPNSTMHRLSRLDRQLEPAQWARALDRKSSEKARTPRN